MSDSHRPISTRRHRIEELRDELSHWRRTTLTPETVSALCALEDELGTLREMLDAEARAQSEQCAFVFPTPSAIA
jgi:hypothetical protein